VFGALRTWFDGALRHRPGRRLPPHAEVALLPVQVIGKAALSLSGQPGRLRAQTSQVAFGSGCRHGWIDFQIP
jgi:hypothetical protein